MSSRPSQSLETKKPIKRRYNSSSKLTAEETSRRIIFLATESLIPFDKVDELYFKAFLASTVNYDSSASFIPDSDVLLHLANEIYNDYQEYFRNYFSSKPHVRMSLTIHKWDPPNEAAPYLFINGHYINDNYRLCELSLGLIREAELSNFLVTNLLLKNRLSFITTNFTLDEGLSDMLAYIAGQDSIDHKVIYCVPQMINNTLIRFFQELSLQMDNTEIDVSSLEYIQNSRHVIPSILYLFLSKVLKKFESLHLEDLQPKSEDKEQDYYNCLIKTWLSSQRSCSLIYIKCLLFYKDQISLLSGNEVTEAEWELMQFCEKFSFRFYEILLNCNDPNSDPVMHMVLKWLKILILHVSSFIKSKVTIPPIKLDQILGSVLDILRAVHLEFERKFDLTLASYLHPHTKRYLKDEHIGQINSFVGSLSKSSETKDSTSHGESMDDIIMQMFDCSGKATKECYNYETSATNEINYSKSADYLQQEAGPYILQFWNRNKDKYANLASLAKHNLAIQPSTDRSFQNFKNAFSDMQRATMYRSHISCGIEAIFYLHCLSKKYDLNAFDPKDLDSDIEEYRIDSVDEIDATDDSFSSESKGSTFSIFEISKKLRR